MGKRILSLIFFIFFQLFSFNINASAYHLIFLVHDLTNSGTSKCLRICHGHGKKEFGTIYDITKYGCSIQDIEFFQKIHGKIITNKDKRYRQILDLVKDATKFDDYWGDGDGFEYEDKISKAEQKKLDEYEKIQENAKNKLEEILRSLVE